VTVPTDPSERPGAGVWLGVDVGTVRIGVARTDPRGVLAVPVETVARDRKHGRDFARLVELVQEHEAVGVVVGLPLTLAGEHGSSAGMATDFAAELRARIAPVPVILVDERLSTVSAMRILSANGVRARAGRAVIDQVAAVQILQGWLDAHPHPTEAE
jgi:putative holliday junction resolvase